MAYLPQPWASTPRTWTSWRSCHGILVRPSSVVGSFSDIWLLEVSGEGRWWGSVGFQEFPKTLCQLGLQIMDSMTHPGLCQKKLWIPITEETRACLRQDWIQASDSITGMFWLCLSSVLVDATPALMRRETFIILLPRFYDQSLKPVLTGPHWVTYLPPSQSLWLGV